MNEFEIALEANKQLLKTITDKSNYKGPTYKEQSTEWSKSLKELHTYLEER